MSLLRTVKKTDRTRHRGKCTLIHLHEWHNLLLAWLNANTSGINAPFLPDGYNRKTYPELNAEFFKKHQPASLDKAKELVKKPHEDVMKLAEKFSNDELFTKKHYRWVGTSNLGSYSISVTASHCDWAIKKLKAHIKRIADGK